jgi:hypothetical protein
LSNQIPNNLELIVTSSKSIIIFYFLISILITFFPSRQDVYNSPLLYAATAVILGFAVLKFDLTSAFRVFELTSISAIIVLIVGIIIFYTINKLIWK